MKYAIVLGALAFVTGIAMASDPASAEDLRACVSVSGKTVYNNCHGKINFRYCTPHADSYVPETCGKGDGDNLYYPRGFYMDAGTTRDVAVPDGDPFNYVVCPYRHYVHSDSRGNFSCVHW